MRPKRERLLKNMLAGFGMTLLMLVLVDLLLSDMLLFRSYSETLNTEIRYGAPLARSDYLPFTLKPSDRYQVNALGYRGQYPEQIEKPVGVKRVLLFGDSFVFGFGLMDVDDTYAAQLQTLMGDGYEVINAGYHCGYSPDAYYACLLREGMALEPDVIVLNIYTGNDLLDMETNDWRLKNAMGAPLSVSTTRRYTDGDGRLLYPEALPWYYTVPILNERRLWIGLLETITHLIPTARPDVRARWVTVLDAFARVDVPVCVYLFDSPIRDNLPDVEADVFMGATAAARFDCARNNVGRYDDTLTIPGDYHFNRQGGGVMARRVMEMIQGK